MNLKEKRELGRLGTLGLFAAIWMTLVPAVQADYPSLSKGLASFGGAVAGDSLYVYGGHVGKTHQHSIENLWHRFARLDLLHPERGWQDLGPTRGLQGLALVADGDQVCRIGGLEARNHADAEEEDLVSIDEVACFDPTTKVWQNLPPLPQPRSSHDAVIHRDHLYVIGGWQLRGLGQDPVWQDHMATLDLRAEQPVWREVAQPFERRALAVAAAEGRVVAFGGIETEGTSRAVEIFDLATQEWSRGPDLPPVAGRLKGFGIAAFGVGDRIYVSAGDGLVHALAGDRWLERLAQLETPRFFHRLLVHDEQAFFVAGAGSGGEGHLGDVETLALASLDMPGSVPWPSANGGVQRAGAVSSDASGAWPGFRGRGNGQADAMALPVAWSAERDVAWSVDLPGYGQSAPVVWGQQVFVSSVEGTEKETLLLSAFDLDTGALRWRRRFAASQEVENTEMVSRGAPTPAADGDRLYAFWESGDLVALDHHGETLWKRSLTGEYGPFQGNHGVASSPVLTADAVVMQVTHEGPSYVVAIDKLTGKNLWKADRPAKVTWTTPSVVEGEDGTEIVVSAPGRVECLDAATGEQRWVFEDVEKNHIPSAVVADNVVIVASSNPGDNLALRRGGHGTLGEDHVIWRAEGVASGFGSPLVHGDCVFIANKAGSVSCVDLESGSVRWRQRLGGALWASPIAAGDHAYFFTKEGQTIVLRAGELAAEVVAENALPVEGTVYGVAATEGAFLVRTGRQLVRIGLPIQQPITDSPTSIAEVAHDAQAQ